MNDSMNMSDIDEAIIATAGFMKLVFFMVGAPANLAVIGLGLKICANEQYRSQMLVVSMSTADLIFTGVVCPMGFVQYVFKIHYQLHLCRLMFLCSYLSTISSSISLLLLNVDKFLHLSKPMHYGIIATPERMLRGTILSWIFAAGCSLLFLYAPGTRMSRTECNVEADDLTAYTTFTFVFFITPNIFSFLISVYVLSIATRMRRSTLVVSLSTLDIQRQKAATEKTKHSLPMVGLRSGRKEDGSGEISTDPRSSCPYVRLKPRKTRRLPLAFVFTTTIWSIFTTLPYRIAFILISVGYISSTHASFVLILFLLIPLNPTLNPLITFITQRVYLQALRGLRRKRPDLFSSSNQTNTGPGRYDGLRTSRSMVVVVTTEPSVDGRLASAL